ncbi:MAG: DNA repair protein RecN [Bacteroidota bacterium]|nr:DNA repair protein RecN [Bacteroidota bacterium]
MLQQLYINNFALIGEMDVTFPGKLTVITGETGAGKSIFLEALGLVLGNRADVAALQNKTKKCIIEATFNVKGLDLVSFFEENEIDPDDAIVLRREISSEGKSRSFLNDTPASLNVLKTLSEKLIDIHSQHQTLLLNQTNFQLEIVDAFAESLELFKNYKSNFSSLTKLSSTLRMLIEQETQAKKELDYFQFLFNELQESEIKTGSLKTLEEESNTLENAETIKTNLLSVANAINGNETNVLSTLAVLKQQLNAISKYNNNYTEFLNRLNSSYIELKELAGDLEDAEGEVNYDAQQLELVNTKLDKLNRLLKKHNVNTEEELLNIKNDIEEKLSQFSSIETQIEKIKKEITQIKTTCTKQANDLTKLRTKALSTIENQVKDILTNLSMPNAVFKIDIQQTSELTSNGFDQVKFLFSANKGASLNELHKVASGGELSRLMLSLKSLLATKKQLPTIIFDEIDTGVSGDVADKIGNILLKMGNTLQVITITHLPQMASKGKHHLFVYKKDEANKTTSYIKELNEEERVNEIAKMLSTGTPTQAALVNAKDLLGSK